MCPKPTVLEKNGPKHWSRDPKISKLSNFKSDYTIRKIFKNELIRSTVGIPLKQVDRVQNRVESVY